MIGELIKAQHAHFGIAYDGPPRELDVDELSFRSGCIAEELSELLLATSLEEQYDALIDLMVFAAGTLERMGLPIEEAFAVIVQSNMTKTLGPNTSRNGFKLDLVKGEEYVAPDLTDLCS